MLDSQFKRNPPKHTTKQWAPNQKVLLSSWLHLRYYFKYSAVSLSLVKLSSLLLHNLHFSHLAPSACKSHLRMWPSRRKLGFSFLACLLSSCRSGREEKVVAISDGNVTEIKSKLSRCKAWCSGVGNGSQLCFLLESAAWSVMQRPPKWQWWLMKSSVSIQCLFLPLS